MKHRMVVSLLSLFVFAIAGVLWLAALASAQVVGPCTATINGVNAASASSPQTAIAVSKDQSIAITVNGPAKFTGHSVALEFAGFKWTVSQQTDDAKSWSDSVDVAKYAKYGVGLYKVVGVSAGNPCSGAAYVNVKGSPLSTAAGAGAAASTVIGVGLMTASAASTLKKQGKFSPSYEEEDDYPGPFWACFAMLPAAAIWTVAFMVSGAGTPGSPATPRKVGFKPLISVAGVIGAFLAGLGTLVLAQQFGTVYPTRTVTIVWLVVAVLIEVVLATVARRSGLKRALKSRVAAPTPEAAGPEPTA